MSCVTDDLEYPDRPVRRRLARPRAGGRGGGRPAPRPGRPRLARGVPRGRCRPVGRRPAAQPTPEVRWDRLQTASAGRSARCGRPAAEALPPRSRSNSPGYADGTLTPAEARLVEARLAGRPAGPAGGRVYASLERRGRRRPRRPPPAVRWDALADHLSGAVDARPTRPDARLAMSAGRRTAAAAATSYKIDAYRPAPATAAAVAGRARVGGPVRRSGRAQPARRAPPAASVGGWPSPRGWPSPPACWSPAGCRPGASGARGPRARSSRDRPRRVRHRRRRRPRIEPRRRCEATGRRHRDAGAARRWTAAAAPASPACRSAPAGAGRVGRRLRRVVDPPPPGDRSFGVSAMTAGGARSRRRRPRTTRRRRSRGDRLPPRRSSRTTGPSDLRCRPPAWASIAEPEPGPLAAARRRVHDRRTRPVRSEPRPAAA